MSCPTTQELVEERINRILTQYRESPKLLFLLRQRLGAVADVHRLTCDLPDLFDIDTAVGDQLTLLGKRLGWPRCHCICDVQPVFGFYCADEVQLRPVVGFGGTIETVPFGFACDGETVGGFCETFPVSWDGCDLPDLSLAALGSTWEECASGLSEVCLTDDEVYRRFLKVRRYQFTKQFDLTSFESCLRILFGNSASVIYSGQGRIVIAPGRDLSESEMLLLQLYPRVLPVALGIEIRFYFGDPRVFGFGEGWGGFCETDEELSLSTSNAGKIFGFACDGEDVGGFCEEWLPGGLPIETEDNELVDESGVSIYTGPLTEDAAWLCRVGAPWMCEVDVRPYSC